MECEMYFIPKILMEINILKRKIRVFTIILDHKNHFPILKDKHKPILKTMLKEAKNIISDISKII